MNPGCTCLYALGKELLAETLQLHLSSLTELMECMATKRNPSATDQIPRYLRNNCIVLVLEKREQSSQVSIIYVFLSNFFPSIYLLAQQTAIYSVSLETA